jgi:peptidoglycan/xylan/chitin deacetylase (PgdA/CDA1 family)
MSIVKKIGKKIYRETKHKGRDIAFALGFKKRLFHKAGGSRIVVYHGICQKSHTRFNPIFLTIKIFEAHLKLYKKYFNVLSLDDYYQQRFSSKKFNICITFDDGFANNYKYALPLLEAYQIPATFFVTAIGDAGYDILWTDFLGIVSKYGPKSINYKNKHYYKGRFDKYTSLTTGVTLVDELRSAGFDEKKEMMELLYPLVPFKNQADKEDYWLQMTMDQIKKMAGSPFVTIGSHGYYHNDLSKISNQEAAWEMVKSKQFLESIIQKPVNSIAFPYGAYSMPLIPAAKNAGYSQLLATDFRFADDQFDGTMRERFTVNPFISPVNQMHANITRRYE